MGSHEVAAASGAFTLRDDLDGVRWSEVKADLARDDFDNGRGPEALRRSFEQSAHVVIAWSDERVVGTARLLSDGVCNAYLVDVWTRATHRRRGIGAAMVRALQASVPGQHVGLQTDDAQDFYAALGFRPQPDFYSAVTGSWLGNAANDEVGRLSRPTRSARPAAGGHARRRGARPPGSR